MPRTRKPTNILALKGAFKHDPARGRVRADEPQPTTDIGPAPAHLSALQADAYDELVRKSHAGLLCDSDSVAVEVAAMLLARLRGNGDAFTAGEFGRLQAILGALGMTPAERSKVAAIKKPPTGPDPLDEFHSAG